LGFPIILAAATNSLFEDWKILCASDAIKEQGTRDTRVRTAGMGGLYGVGFELPLGMAVDG